MTVDKSLLEIPGVRALLGCSFGLKVSTPDDKEACPEVATRIIVLHHNGDEMECRFCEPHAAYIMLLTDPHQESVESSTPNPEGPPL